MKVARNSPCPCGSGKKAKKCCEHLIGTSEQTGRWLIATEKFIQSCEGYVEPMPEAEAKLWAQAGCPHGTCQDQENTGCSAPNCGV